MSKGTTETKPEVPAAPVGRAEFELLARRVDALDRGFAMLFGRVEHMAVVLNEVRAEGRLQTEALKKEIKAQGESLHAKLEMITKLLQPKAEM